MLANPGLPIKPESPGVILYRWAEIGDRWASYARLLPAATVQMVKIQTATV